MMRGRIRLIVILGAFLLQPLFSSMLPSWVVPELGFCALMVFTVSMDSEDLVLPAVLILVLTLARDIYSSQFAGASVIAMILTMVLVLVARRLANVESPFFLAMISAGAAVAYKVIYWCIYGILSSPYSFLYMAQRLPSGAIPNMVVTFIALLITSREIIRKRRDKYFR